MEGLLSTGPTPSSLDYTHLGIPQWGMVTLPGVMSFTHSLIKKTKKTFVFEQQALFLIVKRGYNFGIQGT